MRILIILLFAVWSYCQTYEVILLGVASKDAPRETFQKYNPLVNYLSRKVYGGLVKGGVKLRVYQSEEELMQAIKEGSIHIAQLKPQNYIRLKSEIPDLTLCVGELDKGNFFREGYLIIQKHNSVNSYEDLKSFLFGFGPKMDPLLDIAPKAFLEQKGLRIQDIKPQYLEDPEIIKEFVEIGRVRAGVVESTFISEDEQADRFRIFGKLKAPGTIWIISNQIFLSTREKVQKELLSLKESALLNILEVDGYTLINDQHLSEFRQSLQDAMHFYKKRN